MAIDRQLQTEATEAIEWANSRIAKRLDSPTARLATEGIENRRGTRERPADGRTARSLSGAARLGGKLAEQAAEKLALDPKLLREQIKAALGTMKKWKPWEATKLAKRLAKWGPTVSKLGKALGALAVVLEAASLVVEEKRRREFEKLKAEALDDLTKLVAEVTAAVISPGDGTGLADALEGVAAAVDRERERLITAAEGSRLDAGTFAARADVLDETLAHYLTPPPPGAAE